MPFFRCIILVSIIDVDMIMLRIRHIFPYLYYRLYQSMYKTARDRKPELRAFLFVCVIKATYIFTLLLLPLCVIGLNILVVFLVYFAAMFLFALDRSTHEKYKEMMALWKEESESTRQKKVDISNHILCIFIISAPSNHLDYEVFFVNQIDNKY